MKKSALLLFSSFLLLSITCDNKVQKQIAELHSASMALNGEFLPLMEELNQRAISINIQGRALTQEEMSFVSSVGSLEDEHNHWLLDMESLMSMPANKERLEKEQKSDETILALKNKAIELLKTR